MKKLIKLIFVYIITLFILAETIILLEFDKHEISALTQQNVTLQQDIAELQHVIDEYRQVVTGLTEAIEQERQEVEKADRGAEGECRIMTVTAYDLSVESCGKAPGHPEYGITASGARVKEWYTVAAGSELPFGTQIYIPYFAEMPNNGVFVVQDRGGSIKDDCIDVYIADNAACWEFGRRELEVWVMD
jgi:3D (Asp-Asp-Asp) domain-containing protein